MMVLSFATTEQGYNAVTGFEYDNLVKRITDDEPQLGSDAIFSDSIASRTVGEDTICTIRRPVDLKIIPTK